METQMNYILQPPIQDDSSRDDEEVKTDFWTITGEIFYRNHVEPESNCTCREKHHFLFQWSTSTLPEQHIHLWTYCWRKRLKNTGTWTEKENYLMRGQDSQDSFHQRKGHQKDTHGSGWNLRGNKQPLVLMMYGQICGKFVTDAAKKRAKQSWAIEKPKLDNARQLREIFFIEPNDEEFKLTMKAARRHWKFRCQQRCLAKYRQRTVVNHTAILGNARQNTLVLSMPTKARDQG